MAKGFGIAALIVALIAFGVPVVGLFVSWLAAVLAVIAALAGDRVFATVTALVAVVNTFFLSPLTLAMFIGEGQQEGQPVLLIATIVIFAAPFIAMMLNATGRLALGKTSN